MAKIVCCKWVNPAGCDFIARGETVEEILLQAQAHALDEHGVEATPEMLDLVADYIEDE